MRRHTEWLRVDHLLFDGVLEPIAGALHSATGTASACTLREDAARWRTA